MSEAPSDFATRSKENISISHRFLDESGDTTFFGKGHRDIIGEHGVSLTFGIGMLKINDSKVIYFLQIVPAYDEEIQYARKHNTHDLFARFRKAQIPDYIDIKRKNVCL